MLPKDGIEEWRKRVGDKEANKVLVQSSRRGTAMHECVERYLLGHPPPRDLMPNEADLFIRAREVANEYVDNVRCIEGQMVSEYLRCAGTVDLVADFKGKRSIIDWKSSGFPREYEWCYSYFMQEAAYAVMFEENTGLPIENLVTIVSTEDGGTQIFEEKRNDWIYKFIELRKIYEKTVRASTGRGTGSSPGSSTLRRAQGN